MTSPRTPRVYREGDEEPTDVYEVRHTNSQVYRRTFVTVSAHSTTVDRFWAWQAGPSGALLSWNSLTSRLGSYTLTEVPSDDDSAVEVLPETPEPGKLRKIAPMWHDEPCPNCGCDACNCDERDWDPAAKASNPLTAPPPEPTAEDIHQAYLAVNTRNVTFQPPFLDRVKDLVDGYRDEYGPPEWDVVAHLTLSTLRDIGWGPTGSLRAEVDRLNLEIQGYQTNDGYEKGWEHGAADADRLRTQLAEAIEMVKTCTGHPDRANPEIPSHAELIQRAERGSDG